MQRGRLFPQIPDYMFAPDFDSRHRPAQKAAFDYSETPLGGPFFTTAYVKPTIDWTTLKLTWSGTTPVGIHTYTWSVVQAVNANAAGVKITAEQIDELGNGTRSEFRTPPTGTYWSQGGETLFFPPPLVTRIGLSTALSTTWRFFVAPYPP